MMQKGSLSSTAGNSADQAVGREPFCISQHTLAMRSENGVSELAALGNKSPFIFLSLSALKTYTNMNILSVIALKASLLREETVIQ